jgi:hypothetical protein
MPALRTQVSLRTPYLGGRSLEAPLPFAYVNESQREDFEREIRRRNRSLGDFEVSDTPEVIDPPGAATGPLVGKVTIKSRKTEAQRTYSTGGSRSTDPLTKWVREFVRDLDAGGIRIASTWVSPNQRSRGRRRRPETAVA